MEQWLEQTPLLGDSELREVGNLICEKRKARGWSQNDLAGYLGSDYRVVSRHENGHGMNLESFSETAAEQVGFFVVHKKVTIFSENGLANKGGLE